MMFSVKFKYLNNLCIETCLIDNAELKGARQRVLTGTVSGGTSHLAAHRM